MSSGVPKCVCGHAKIKHSFAREEDYKCLQPGCRCSGYAANEREVLPARQIRVTLFEATAIRLRGKVVSHRVDDVTVECEGPWGRIEFEHPMGADEEPYGMDEEVEVVLR